MTPAIHELGPEARCRKLEAVAMYGTQVDAVAESIGRLLSDPQALGYEVAWATVAPERQRCAQGIVREVRGDPLDDRRRGGQARLLAGDH